MPNYYIPTFNLLCDVYPQKVGGGPALTPRLTNVPCQLYGENKYLIVVSLRVAIGTDIRVANETIPALNDLIKCPAGGRTFFEVLEWIPMHYGFPNQYDTYYMQPAGQFSTLPRSHP